VPLLLPRPAAAAARRGEEAGNVIQPNDIQTFTLI
jgi:hypothetical protein